MEPFSLKDKGREKIFFLVVGPLRGGGGKTPPTTKQKTLFSMIKTNDQNLMKYKKINKKN